MQDEATPVAARIDAAQLQTDANLHVQVGPATKRFHIWQQVPAWLLGFAAIGLGFLMVLRGYDSAAGWFAVSTGNAAGARAESGVSTAPSTALGR